MTLDQICQFSSWQETYLLSFFLKVYDTTTECLQMLQMYFMQIVMFRNNVAKKYCRGQC